jgi:hypothetical protein
MPSLRKKPLRNLRRLKLKQLRKLKKLRLKKLSLKNRRVKTSQMRKLRLRHHRWEFLDQVTIHLRLHRVWVFLARWQDRAIILLQVIRVWAADKLHSVQEDLDLPVVHHALAISHVRQDRAVLVQVVQVVQVDQSLV